MLEALGNFWGIDFCPHSIIPVTRNPEYPLWGHVQWHQGLNEMPSLQTSLQKRNYFWLSGKLR